MRCNRFKRFTSQKGANYSHRLAAGVDLCVAIGLTDLSAKKRPLGARVQIRCVAVGLSGSRYKRARTALTCIPANLREL